MTIQAITLSVDLQTITTVDSMNLSLNTLLLYEGDALSEIVYGASDTFSGSENNDKIYGYSGGDAIFGLGGDDWLNGGADTDYIDGGSGIDTAEYGLSSGNYAPSKKSNGDIDLGFFNGGYERLVSIERLKFSDKYIEAKDLTYVGTYTDVSPSNSFAVHRFYNARDKSFFYTADSNEKTGIIANSASTESGSNNDTSWPYVYQGATFEKAHTYSGATPLYRFYNRETGHHFFTASKDEADFVRAKSERGEWPFNYEGVAFNVYRSDPTPNSAGQELAVHRFYSQELNRHFYTSNAGEVDEIRLTGKWSYEGIGFWGEVV